MNQFFSNKKLIILLISVIVVLGLVAFSITGSGNAPIIQRFTNDITALTSRVFSKPANGVVNIIDSVEGLIDTYEENKSLKSKMDQLYETEAKLASLQQDNEKMQEQLELTDTLTDYNSINGAVIGRNPDNWVDQLIIDRGSQNGVEMNMSVMGGNGYIGRIVEVSPTSSKVQLVTTSHQNTGRVSAQVLTENGVVHGIISGYEAETYRLILNQIITDATLKEGDQVVTSGLGGLSPSSLLIGTVDEIKLDSHGLAMEAYITPAADMNDIRFVTIIQRASGSGE